MKSKNNDFKSELETQYSILINTEKKEQRTRTIIILIILLLTLISTLLTTYFSYKSYKSIKQENIANDKMNEYYQVLETNYISGSLINLHINTAYNSGTPYVFYVTNTGDTPIIYNINLSSVKTNIALNENLKYTLSINDQTPISNLLPLNNQTILENIVIKPNEQIKYSLNTSFSGYIDGGAEYSAIIKIEQQKNVSTLIE